MSCNRNKITHLAWLCYSVYAQAFPPLSIRHSERQELFSAKVQKFVPCLEI